jgi:hypothetical protein
MSAKKECREWTAQTSQRQQYIDITASYDSSCTTAIRDKDERQGCRRRRPVFGKTDAHKKIL